MADDDNNDKDKERRAEELDALRSFYGEDLLVADADEWQIRINSRGVVLQITSLSGYPSNSRPEPKLLAPSWALDEGQKNDILSELQSMVLPDTEVAIMWAEHCRAALACDNEDPIQDDKSSAVQDDTTCTTATTPQNCVIAVIDFHHMLIGPGHKKESQVLSAATSYNVDGFIFMGGPCYCITRASNKEDVLGWLTQCKKAGKSGNLTYCKSMSLSALPKDWPSRLKTVAYTSGKGEKPDMKSYKEILSKLNVPYPLPSDG